MSGWAVIVSLGASFVCAVLLTPIVRRVALRWGIIDRPEIAPDRKEPGRHIPLLGGWPIFIAFMLVTIGFYLAGFFNDGSVTGKAMFGLLFGGLILIIGGSLDDRFNLRASQQIIWPILASLVVIASGIGITFLSNPFGGVLQLDRWSLNVFSMDGIDYRLVILADLVTFVWLMGMSYTTKLLDGLDGLVSGLTAIGCLVVFGVTQLADVQQAGTGLLALTLAGSCLGFLVFNFAPARIFLGEGGSLFCGFALGALAIVSGGKIATALLIMGIPILDVIWVIFRRLAFERKSPFTTADRKHLHFRLLDVGFSKREAVLFFYAITAVFGSATLFVRGIAKLYVLGALALVMLLLVTWLVVRLRANDKAKT